MKEIPNMQSAKEPNPTVGSILRKRREEQGLSIGDIVGATKIRHSHIVAIENNDSAKLPEFTYTMGYIKNYADFLGLNSEELVSRARSTYNVRTAGYTTIVQNSALDKKYRPLNILKENIIDFLLIIFTFGSCKKDRSHPQLTSSMNNQRPVANGGKAFKPTKARKALLFYVPVVVVLIVLILIGCYAMKHKITPVLPGEPQNISGQVAESLDLSQLKNSSNPATKDIVIVKKENVTQPIVAVPPIKVPLKVASSVTPWPENAMPSNLTLEAKDDVWVKVYEGAEPSKVYVNTILKAGLILNIPQVTGLQLDVGNFKNLILKHGNQITAIDSPTGSLVVRHIELDTSSN